VDEVVRAARVKQGDKITIPNTKRNLHGVACGNSCDSKERNFGLLGIRDRLLLIVG
jgi:hypothetical protein